MTARPADPVDVLVVGAGPTGLALAARLAAFGASVRVVDRRTVPGRESRALVVQPRTLEVLRPIGVTQALLDRGDRAARVQLHLDGRDLVVPFPDIDADDTAYPFLLVLRQAEVEAALLAHLAAQGAVGGVGSRAAVLPRRGGRRRRRAPASLGADNAAASTLSGGLRRRRQHRQAPGRCGLHGRGLPELGAAGRPRPRRRPCRPGSARVPRPPRHPHPRGRRRACPVAAAGRPGQPGRHRQRAGRRRCPGHRRAGQRGRICARKVAWTTQVPLQHRLAATFRSGRAFLAGDAAHVDSPAGAQGMNNGIQDAVNLGWKLGLAAQGAASEALLDTYGAERRPVARAVLALTHALFWLESADSPVVRRARVALAPLAISTALRLAPLRTLGFRVIGQQWIRYPRGLAAVDGLPKLRRGPAAGDRLPDLLLLRDQLPCRLQQALATPAFHLLLCGPPHLWDLQRLARLQEQYGNLVGVHRLGTGPLPGQLSDPSGAALARLGASNGAQYLVRPDGHVGYRCAGFDLAGLERHMARLLPGQRTARPQ